VNASGYIFSYLLKDSSHLLQEVSTLLLISIWEKKVTWVGRWLEALWEQFGFSEQLTLVRGSAVDRFDNFTERDPSILGSRLVGGHGHDESNETVLTGTWDWSVVDERLAESNGLGDVGLVVTGKEEIIRHIGVSGKV
jgi:hypothetical protein